MGLIQLIRLTVNWQVGLATVRIALQFSRTTLIGSQLPGARNRSPYQKHDPTKST
jgi:hypothetical protein